MKRLSYQYLGGFSMTQIIPDNIKNEQVLIKEIDAFFRRYINSSLLKKCGFYKRGGFPCISILRSLFSLVFTHKNLWRSLESTSALPFKKNTAYRFINEGKFNWEKLVFSVAEKIVAYFSLMTSKDRASALVIDDSLLTRDRSKNVELFSRVFDHTTHKYRKGFRMLTLGWTDGSSFIPLNFRLLSSQKESNVLCASTILEDKRTLECKRRNKATSSTIDMVLDLLEQAKNIPAKYVLFDSWFTMPKTVAAIKAMHREVIGMVRITEKIHYLYNGKWQNIKSIYSQIEKSKDNPIVGTANIMLRADKSSPEGTWIKARLVFVKNRNGKSDTWLALLSTDVEINAEETVRIYGKRWDIEVFFKMCKSHLALGKEYQGRSYDAQVSTTAIVFLRYMMIAESVRIDSDQKTWGEIFFRFCDEVSDIQYSESMKLLVNAMIDILRESPVLTSAQVDALIEQFLSVLPKYIQAGLRLSS